MDGLRKKLKDFKSNGKRETVTISIRKQANDDFMASKRQVFLGGTVTEPFDDQKLRQLLWSDDPVSIEKSLDLIHGYLRDGLHPIFTEPLFIQRMIEIANSEHESFVSSALATFSNLCCAAITPEDCAPFIRSGLIPLCIQLASQAIPPPTPPTNPLFPNACLPAPVVISSGRQTIAQLSFLTIANLCNACESIRHELIMVHQAHKLLISWMNSLKAEFANLIPDCAWCLRILCSKIEIPDAEVSMVVECGAKLIHSKNSEVLFHSLVVLSTVFLVNGGPNFSLREPVRAERCMNLFGPLGVSSKVLEVIDHANNSDIRQSALKLMTRMTNVPENHIDSLISMNALEICGKRAISDEDRNRALALFSLSNFAASNTAHKKKVMAVEGLLQHLARIIFEDSKHITSECIYVLVNLCDNSSPQIAMQLHDHGVTDALIEYLRRPDALTKHVIAALGLNALVKQSLMLSDADLIEWTGNENTNNPILFRLMELGASQLAQTHRDCSTSTEERDAFDQLVRLVPDEEDDEYDDKLQNNSLTPFGSSAIPADADFNIM